MASITSYTQAQLDSRLGVYLPATNGTDDTSAINAVLTGAAGKTVRGRPGTTYIISAPIVLPAGGNITLDMTGCRVLLSPTVNSNLLNNAAVTPSRSTNDAAISAASTTLTSASAAFTAADVGRYVKISGANVSGDLLVARITVYTNATTVTIDTAAVTTVTAAALAIHATDSDITLIGGTWDRGPFGGTAQNNTVNDHDIRIRFTDRLIIRGMTHTSGRGKYAINVAGVTRFRITDHFYAGTASDGVHIAGPSSYGVIANLSGSTNDDMFAITPQEPLAWDFFNDCIGDVAHISAEHIQKISGPARITHVTHGRSGNAIDIKISDVSGGCDDWPVWIWSDTSRPGGKIDGLTIRGVNAKSVNDYANVYFQSVTATRVEVSEVVIPHTSAAPAVQVTSGSIDTLILDKIEKRGGGTGPHTRLEGSGTYQRVIMSRCVLQNAASGSFAIGLVDTTTIDWFDITDSDFRFLGGNSYVVRGVVNCNINTLNLRGVTGTNPAQAGNMIGIDGGGPVCNRIFLSDVRVNGFYRLADLGTTTDVSFHGVYGINTSGTLISSGAITVRGTTPKFDGNDGFATAGGTITNLLGQ